MTSLAIALRLEAYFQQHNQIHRRKYGETCLVTREQFARDLHARMMFIAANGGIL